MASPMTSRPLARLIAVVLLSVFAAAILSIIYRTELTTWLALQGLERLGVPAARLSVTAVGLRGAVIQDIALGTNDEVEVDNLVITYSPSALVRGSIKSIELVRPRMKLDLRGGSILGSLQTAIEQPRSAENGRTEPAIRLPTIAVTDGTVQAIHAAGVVTATVNGEVGLRDSAPFAQLHARLDGDGIDPDTSVYMDLSEDGLLNYRIAAGFDLASGLWRDLGYIDELSGDLQIALTGTAQIPDIASVHSPGTPLPTISGDGVVSVKNVILHPFARSIEANVPIAFTMNDGVIDLELAGGGTATMMLPHVDDDQIRLSLGGDKETPLRVHAEPEGGTLGVQIDGEPFLSSDSGLVLRCIGGISVILDDRRLVNRVAASDLNVELDIHGNPAVPVSAIFLRSPVGLDMQRTEDQWYVQVKSRDAKLLARVIETGTGTPDVSASWRTLDINGVLKTRESSEFSVDLFDGLLELSEPELIIDGISATTSIRTDTGTALLDYSIGRLRDTAEKLRFEPVTIDGHAEINPHGVSTEGLAKPIGHDASVRFVATHSNKTGDGRLSVIVNDMAFVPGELQPHDFSPLAKVAEDVSGKVDLEARAEWSREGRESHGQIVLKDIDLRVGAISVSDLDLALEVDDFNSPISPPRQRISVGRIDAGIPLTNVSGLLQVRRGQPAYLLIESAQLTALGALVGIDETVVDPTRERHAVEIEISHLDLAALLEQAGPTGLSGEGTLSGTIPVEVGKDGFAIRNARLSALGPGVIRYKSTTGRDALADGGEQVELMLGALEDYRFEVFDAHIEKSLNGDASLSIRMQGHNPALLDGHPVHFNVNLSGNVDPIVEALTQGQRISTDILRQAWELSP